MDSPQSVVSPFKNLTVGGAEPEKQRSDVLVRGSDHISNGVDKNGVNIHNPENFIGVLDVYVHQARDIHNICIYHKQDVYAKLHLTSDPENAVSTKIINGGGQNPVFDDNIRLNVRTIESSLKCEIWMLSRVKNYLEDQLLGFALVPLSEVFIKNGKLERDFSLSSSDLFHSPAGFVQLSISYSGATPEFMAIPKDVVQQPSEPLDSVQSDFDKIEFPDPNIMKENQMMVSEYFGIPCNRLDSSDTESHELGVLVVESFSANSEESKPLSSAESPPSCVSANGSQFSETQVTSKSPTHDHVPNKDVGDGESESSNGNEPSKEISIKPLISVNFEPEVKVVQQDIVDLYLKSMQPFTESLAKMNLQIDLDSEPSKSGNSSSDKKLETPKSTGSRVFYGSSAFF